MGRLSRVAGAILVVLLLAAPVSAGQRSDAKLFEIAQAEQVAQQETFDGAWALYQASTSASEKATALNDVEAAVTETERRLGRLEVRPCFRPWFRAVTDLWAMLAKAVGYIRTEGMLTPDEVALGTALITLIRGDRFATYFDCGAG